MTDIEFDNFLNLGYQPLSYHNEDVHQAFNQYSVASESHVNYFDDIEHIYTGLHKSVDQMVAQTSVRTPPRLDQIREQNRRRIDKLITLEASITDDATTVDVVLS